MSKPWMKFYPADWRADPGLRMCSLSARGLWVELLGYMHQAEPYGYLLIAGRSPSEDEIAILVGATSTEVKKRLAELKFRGVFSENSEEILFSRRMVRDHEKSIRDQVNGATGGNPKLKQNNELNSQGVNPPDKWLDMVPDKAARAPAPSESRYQSPEKESSLREPVSPRPRPDGAFLAMVEVWKEELGRHRLPIPTKPTTARAKKCTARLRDDFSGDLNNFRDFCRRIARSRFLTGPKADFKVSFDWVLQPANLTKIIEGNYDDAPAVEQQPVSGPKGPPPSPEEIFGTGD